MEVATYFIVFRRYLAESRDAFTSPILLHALSHLNDVSSNVISFHGLIIGKPIGYLPVLRVRRDSDILDEYFSRARTRDRQCHELTARFAGENS